MARGISDLLLKKNSKLESYLKRSVSEETYERIRAYESCIIISEKENKTFKYVVLGDEWIYLTENPPKTIQQVVNLGDIVDVDLVDDEVEFFSADERKNILHVRVTYWTTEPAKKPWTKSFRRIRLSSDFSIDRSNASTPMGYAESVESLNEDSGYNTQGTASSQLFVRPDSEASSSSNRDLSRSIIPKKKKKQLNDSLDHESYLQALKEIEEDVVVEREDKRLKTAHSAHEKVPVSPKHTRERFSQSYPQMHSKKDLEPEDRPLPAVKTKQCCWPIRCRCISSQVMPLSCGHKEDKRSPMTSPVNFSVAQKQHPLVPQIVLESLPSVNGRASSRQSPDILSARESIGKSKLLTDEKVRSSMGYATMSDLGDSISNLHMLPGQPEKRKTEIHIYLLNPTSPMHMLIKSAWNNFLIRSTLMLNPDFKSLSKSPTIVHGGSFREKAEYLFSQLKREILDTSNSMEDTYASLNELKIATEKNFALKKLFWRNSDLFLAMVRFLQQYLPKSPININTEQGRNARIDEFTFVTLVTEILSQEFRETEVIPSRIQTLKSERGKAVLDLLMALTCIPDLPEKYGSLSKKADEELLLQFEEFTRAAITAVFELFLMAQQANWNHSEGNFFNICWMIRVLEEIRTTEKFVERVINQMMELLSPSKLETLIPEEAVMLYQQFSIISNFLDYSPRITNFIRNNYEEEFRYFIQVPAVDKKLPLQYPLSRHTRHLMDRVISKVLASSASALNRFSLVLVN